MQLYIFLSKSMIKYPVYKYGRHWPSQPMRIEAPIPYIRICPSTRSVQDTQICVLFHMKKNAKKIFLFCQHRPIYEYAIGPEVSRTPVIWCFAIICIILQLVKNAHLFYLCPYRPIHPMTRSLNNTWKWVFFLRLN